MNKLIVESIKSTDKSIQIRFNVSGEDAWIKLFNTPYIMEIDYDISIEKVPDSVAIIPFVANFIPMVWLFDAEMHIPDIDKAYYESIPEFKKGFENMHKKFQCGGKIVTEKITENHSLVSAEKSAAFFSGGVDATNTLINHIDENPVMITLWGADMSVDNTEGWGNIYNHVVNASKTFGLELRIVKSNFKALLNIDNLNSFIQTKEFTSNWYEHFYYGIAFFGQIAPLAFILGFSVVYLASTNSYEDIGNYICGSDPTIDDYIRFVDARAVHDSFNITRQDKIHNICNYRKQKNIASPLRVCWKSKSAVNCCDCEKCFRTIIGIIAEGENPVEYGFPYYTDEVRKKMMTDLQKIYKIKYHSVYYKPIQAALKEKYTFKECPQDLKWLYKTRFVNHSPEYFKVYTFASNIAHKVLSVFRINSK